MMDFFRRVKGSVSLILIFVMFPLLTQATMIVDASRINSAKTAVSGAGDLAMNAALSQYDKALQDIYGLFAVSGNDINTLQTTFEAYFGNTLQGMLSGSDSVTQDYIDQLTTGVVDGIFGSENISEEDMVNHLAMETIDMTISGHNASTLANPTVMKTQIVEYMKYKAPLMFTTEIMDQLNAIGGSKSQSEAVQAQVDYTQSLDTLQSACQEARTSIDTYNGNVIALDTAAGSANAVAGMFADNGTVKNELINATNNLLYYRNIYDNYWGGENPIFSYSDFNNALLSKLDVPEYAFDGSAASQKYTGIIRDAETGFTYEVLKPTESPLENLNKEMLSSNEGGSTEKILVKDSQYSSGNYEELYALQYVVASSKGEVKIYENSINDINNTFNLLETPGMYTKMSYIQSYHTNIVQRYSGENLSSEENLADYVSKLRNYGTAYSNFIKKLDSLVDHILSESNAMLPYILKDSKTNQSYEDEATLTNTEKLRLEAFKADYKILCDFIDFGQIESAITSGNYPKITEHEGKKSYDFELNYNTIWEKRNSAVKGYESNNDSYSGMNFSIRLYQAINNCEAYRDSYKNDADAAFTNTWNTINTYKNQLDTVKNNITDVASKLATVKQKADDVRESHKNWDVKIEATPDGATKQTMESQSEAESEKIIPEEIDALIAYANAQKGAYEDLITKLNSITYFGEKVYSGQMNADTFVSGASGGSWRGESYNSITAIADITKSDAVTAKANELISSFYQPADGGIISDTINKVSIANGEKFMQFGYGPDVEEVEKKSHPNTTYFIDKYADCDEQLALGFYNKLLSYTKSPVGQQENSGSIQSQVVDKAPEGSENTNPSSTVASDRISSENISDLEAAFGAISSKSNEKTDGSNNKAEAIESVSGGMNKMNDIKAEDNSGIANSLKGNMSATNDYLGKVTQLAGTAMNVMLNYAYLEEYFTNMFSCYTTNKSEDGNDLPEDKYETTLEGIILCKENNKYFGAEQEYIIWGGNAQTSVAKTMGTIFAIRFVLNTIYAFTSAEIQSTACSIATAIAGWTVFGVPLVQAIVTMVFALAESGLDLADLSVGKSVPIYKSATTWKCSISGVTRQTATCVLNEVVDKGTDFVSQLASETITDLSSSATDYINGQIDSAVKTLKDSLFAATTGPILEMYGSFGNNVTAQKDAVKAKLKESINNMTSKIGDETPIQKAAKEGAEQLTSSYIDTFVDDAFKVLEETIDKGDDFIYEFQNKISKKINYYIDGKEEPGSSTENPNAIKLVVEKKIKQLTKKLDDAAQQMITDTSEQAKAKVKEAFSEYAEGAADKVKKVDAKDAKTISMNYKQYVKIFMLVGLLVDQDSMLNRCAALIQCNINHIPNTNCKYKPSEGYNLSIPNSYTLVKADAEVQIKTIFSYSASATGGASDIDGLYSDLAPLWESNGTSTLKYYSVTGY